MSENRLRANNLVDSESDLKETTFSENSGSTSSAPMARNITDPKLEKKVTFARLLNKVSAEMSSGSEIDIGQMVGTRNSSALSLPTEIQFRTSSMPTSPCTNDMRSPHSTSSNQGSDSLSSSDMALTDFGLQSMQTSSNDIGGSTNSSYTGLYLGNLSTRYRLGMSNNTNQRPKVCSADSILAMFRNLPTQPINAERTLEQTPLTNNTCNNTQNLPTVTLNTNVLVSPTNTISPSQDDIICDDESSSSSLYTPVSNSSIAPDSPILYRHSNTIEVPVLDVLNVHKANMSVPATQSNSSTSCNLLHPPTILLEIPNNGINNKCLSPIREMPTPIPSPALTPIMPRPQRVQSPIFQEDPLNQTNYSEDDGQYDDEDEDACSEELSDHLSVDSDDGIVIEFNKKQHRWFS